MSNYTLREIGNRQLYRDLIQANPDNSGNPKYAKRGKRSQRFTELPPKVEFRKKEQRQEKPNTITKKELMGLLKRLESINLIDAGYEVLLSLTQTVRKQKVGAVSRYVVKGN